MKRYAVVVRATVTKTLFVDAANEDDASNQAREEFTTECEPGEDEAYDEETVSIEQVEGVKTDAPCPHCGRNEDGKWFSPCPSDDCPSHEVEVAA